MEIAPQDRELIDRLKRAIDDPATREPERARLREELGGIADGLAHFECLTDEEQKRYRETGKL